MSGFFRKLSTWASPIGFVIGILATNAWAADEGSSWRGTYDVFMLWINFGILVVLFLKFLKKPIVDFLNLRKEQTEIELRKLEEEKKQADADSLKTTELINKGEAHIAGIKQRIIAQGEREKERIINDAQSQSRYLLADAKQRIQHQIGQAGEKLKVEMIDAAIQLAMERLPKELSEADHHALLESYLAGPTP